MKLRTWVALLLLVPVAAVAAMNWSALVTPVAVNLWVTTVRAPLWPAVLGVPVVLAGVFLGAALLDRARQLRQVAALERQLEEARATVERGREQALDGVVADLGGRIAALEAVVEGVASGLEARLNDRLARADERREARERDVAERLAALSERITRVRDELAADVAE
ncbi:MAG: hypothetical protein P1P87_16705, partial [Trueperaceae bacterium]|nr:hypothetical protein [Trueperaceae bacterium]